jgi:hypothetical protein
MPVTNLELTTISNIIFDKIIAYLDSNGITIIKSDLEHNINISIKDIKPKPKIKFKPKSKIKFKLKPKSNYKIFINICNSNNIVYFQYYDEHNWTGPAIKIDNTDYNTIKFFSKFNYTTINGTDFHLIRPSTFEDDSKINYDNANAIITNSTANYNSDDQSTDELITEEWEYRNTIYLLDKETNNVYTYQTMEFVGKKTDDYEIDFDAKEE